MSNSVRPHRRQPIRLPRPWDSPGKNTGVGCHFLLQCMKVKSESEVAQSCPTLSDLMDCCLPGSSIHGVVQARVLEWGAIAFSDFTIYTYIKSLCCKSKANTLIYQLYLNKTEEESQREVQVWDMNQLGEEILKTVGFVSVERAILRQCINEI